MASPGLLGNSRFQVTLTPRSRILPSQEKGPRRTCGLPPCRSTTPFLLNLRVFCSSRLKKTIDFGAFPLDVLFDINPLFAAPPFFLHLLAPLGKGRPSFCWFACRALRGFRHYGFISSPIAVLSSPKVLLVSASRFLRTTDLFLRGSDVLYIGE